MHRFFDRDRNLEAKGIKHQFKLKEINSDKVVFDEATGLMWQQSGSLHKFYVENTSEWIKELNREGYAGFKDWRLPTLEEAMSIMEPDRKNGDLYIDTVFNKRQRSIWTVDQVKQASGEAWCVHFVRGLCYIPTFDSSISYIRAVHSRKQQSF